MAKMKTKWIALCSSAIAAVYSAGLFITNEDFNNTLPDIPQQSALSIPYDVATPTDSTPTYNAQPTNKYKNGTFHGTGSNRRGSIQVTVIIKNDAISEVEIGNFAMHYSERDISGLPNEVLQSQSAKVQNVSGATYSTRAFEDAVQDALDQARNG
ncbi:FMN-binding protein [Cohnella lupini]|uniref:Uncharacterized protein with FMN-binding domain n=1 Tax=Cohnella lupini TaxID=1294267 RepID=A0A3D9HYX8_9BACL|nr:FMN-binding protein [Cohnella lupini]RED54728.1 uncharacterized protein with FMN-binding domain [Cohnella lupini]